MKKTPERIPYFDNLPEKFDAGDLDAIAAFGRHIHWGYWEVPTKADGSIADFGAAAESLSQRMINLAQIEPGMSILDAGCGFGGTIAIVNDRCSNLDLVGVNIDSQQVSRAREEVKGRDNNRIQFICADACQLPLADNSCDRILAVECIFGFPSREKFFQQAHRVLKPGGKMVICDFLPVETIGSLWRWSEKWLKPLVGRTYGGFSINFLTLSEYQKLAQATGFKVGVIDDITRNTLPTYPVVNRLMMATGDSDTYWSTKGLEIVSNLGLLRYVILEFILN
jgi:ubiquinone/menaquinone biosynthesis C-methylase UbiE